MIALTPEYASFFRPAAKQSLAAIPAPDDWQDWLYALFPKHVGGSFAQRHVDLWEWAWSITEDSAPRPFVAIWPRGGGKSTSAELIAAAVGTRGTRKYCLYVRETQEKADQSVANVAALLESPQVSRHYPTHADRMLSKFGTSKGWRRNRLRTQGGFTIDALGLDVASRGAKVDDQRPDFIIFDDIDDKDDTAGATQKKIGTITKSIIPAGSNNVAVLAIQNLIIPDGVFSRLADGRADFLADRQVSGPFPAVEDLETELYEDEETGTRKARIINGTPSWDGQNLATCQRNIDLFGLSAFLAECQHDVSARKEGVALRFGQAHYADLTDAEIKTLVGYGRVFAGLDFGAWRFAFVLFAVNRAGVVYAIDEYFSQRQTHSVRAKHIHERLEYWGISALVIRGDAANPQDIMELNAAFHRGWTDPSTNKLIRSPYRVAPVAMVNKERATSVERINRLLDEMSLRVCRSIGSGQTWREGWNASSAGTEMQGSRLTWEMGKWAYPIPQPGKAQAQDPDDHTADGADMIAAERYGIMSYLRPANAETPPDPQLVLDNIPQHTIGQVRNARDRQKKQMVRRLGGL
jgi:hypothetical protein